MVWGGRAPWTGTSEEELASTVLVMRPTVRRSWKLLKRCDKYLKLFLPYVTLASMRRMHQLADEIRETFEDRGWKIEKATQLDLAFSKTRKSRSSLGRDLVLDAIDEATIRIGLGCRSVSGGGRDVIDLVDGADRRFRVRKADIDPDNGEYDIICTSDSILVIADAEPESLIPTERWVLGYTVDDEGMIVDIFAARVLGISEERFHVSGSVR